MYITYFYEHIFNVKSLIDDFQKQGILCDLTYKSNPETSDNKKFIYINQTNLKIFDFPYEMKDLIIKIAHNNNFIFTNNSFTNRLIFEYNPTKSKLTNK